MQRKRDRFFLGMSSDGQAALEDRNCNGRNSDIRKKKNRYQDKVFPYQNNQKPGQFPREAGDRISIPEDERF